MARYRAKNLSDLGAYLPMDVGVTATLLLLIVRLGLEYDILTEDVKSRSSVD